MAWQIGPVHSLCGSCSAIFPLEKASTRINVPHYKTVRELIEAAAETSCALCAAIQHWWPLDQIKERFPNGTHEQLLATELEFWLNDDPDVSIRPAAGSLEYLKVKSTVLHGLLYSKQRPVADSIYLQITTAEVCEEPARKVQYVWKTSSPTTTVREKHEFIKACLSHCQTDHGACQGSSTETPRALPKRLIHIRKDASYNDLQPRLVSSSDLPERSVRFAALSHCWGAQVPVRTMRAKIGNFALGLEMQPRPGESSCNILPRTFRDAIALCAFLGIEYLWIDSLCIVQDDPEEWSAEAARMKNVYADAVLTIAASHAACSADGLFVDQPPPGIPAYLHEVSKFNVKCRRALEDSTYSTAHEHPDNEVILAVRVYKDELERRSSHSILSKRGWVLQEQVLSRRIIHCTYPELHWQCSCLYLTEAGLTSQKDHAFSKSRIPTMSEIQLGSLNREPTSNTDIMHDTWNRWMEVYSDRHFTFAKDGLAALSGIVDRFVELTGFQNLLGSCWAETLCKDLAWHGNQTTAYQRNGALPGMPSWTWLSRVNGLRIDYWTRNVEGSHKDGLVTDCVSLVGADIAWTGIPLLSELKQARLILRGPFKQATLSTTPVAYVHDPPFFDIDCRDHAPIRRIEWAGSGCLDHASEDGVGSVLHGTYTCLLLRVYKPNDAPGVYRHTFLIVQKVFEGHSEDNSLDSCSLYRRIGIGGLFNQRTYFDDAVVKTIALV